MKKRRIDGKLTGDQRRVTAEPHLYTGPPRGGLSEEGTTLRLRRRHPQREGRRLTPLYFCRTEITAAIMDQL